MTIDQVEKLTRDIRELKTIIEESKSRMKLQNRPALSTKCQVDDLHFKAIDDYLRRGDEAELRGMNFEEKSLSKAVNSDGGFLVDPQTSEQIASSLFDHASLRSISNVVQVESGHYDILIDHGSFESGWSGEEAARGETQTGEFARISIALHELSAMPKSSQRLLDDAAFDVETWLAGRIAESFSQSESQAFILGDGNDKPNGILSHNIVDDASWVWGSIGAVKTGVEGDFDAAKPADALIELVYALPARYRKNAHFVLNSKTAGAVRKMKDSDGRFLWDFAGTQEHGASLLGYPVLICEDMPDVGAGNAAIAFGDFRSAYTIAERPDLRILRDPFSAKPHVLFYATKRVGGDVTDFAAIKLLQFSA